jgi:hypothetical protein
MPPSSAADIGVGPLGSCALIAAISAASCVSVGAASAVSVPTSTLGVAQAPTLHEFSLHCPSGKNLRATSRSAAPGSPKNAFRALVEFTHLLSLSIEPDLSNVMNIVSGASSASIDSLAHSIVLTVLPPEPPMLKPAPLPPSLEPPPALPPPVLEPAPVLLPAPLPPEPFGESGAQAASNARTQPRPRDFMTQGYCNARSSQALATALEN